MAIERPTFTPPDWYTSETAEEIQARMMSRLPEDIDNIEGGFPYDFTMPTALERDELVNFYLIETLKIMFPAWSYGSWLDYHATTAGLTRRPANQATGTVTFTGVPGTQIPAGTVVCVPAVGDTPAIEYTTDDVAVIGAAGNGETYGTVDVAVTAVEGGIESNVSAGTIVIMATPITGVASLTNAAAITGGTAEESDDDLYERIVEADASAGESYIGCDADYIRWAKEVSGVGTVLVDAQYEQSHPNWVRLIILDGNGQPANAQILAAVYAHIMHPNNRAVERLAPIGAILVVEAPSGVDLTINIAGLQIEGDYTATDIVDTFKASLEKYYIEAKEDGAVKWNRIHAIFTDTAGVADFATLTVNGGTANITLDSDDYPVTHEVNVT